MFVVWRLQSPEDITVLLLAEIDNIN